MIEAWFKSEHPNWQDWRNLGSISMLEAILLSMDICPNWYRTEVLGAVQNCFELSEYRRPVLDEKVEWIKEVYEYVDAELDKRLKISKSWFGQQDWVLGAEATSPADISFDTLVDHGKFLKFAFEKMGFENECDFIPDDLKGTVEDGAAVEQPLSSKDWTVKAKLYAMECLEKNLGLNLDELAGLVSKRFNQEKIFASHGGNKPIAKSSIKTVLSKSGWFTQAKLKAAK